MTTRPCPIEIPPDLLECPRGCGLVTLAKPSLRWGPWRMQVHLLNPRCPTPIPGSNSTYMTPADLRRYRNNQPRGHR
ncbi:hypothetical protein [Mycolicibacterium mageritense]|uniref:hypothetical protein n=1 Tax=Mycolicibacterium mageritense TaxID=53462 RepID=UPI001E28BCED|nr:hypothetical protein [Mycolicibacterium mageritense]GJJ21092.1 hypothetical protein MTY414_47650 [Mycolicibacterium mageritense]